MVRSRFAAFVLMLAASVAALAADKKACTDSVLCVGLNSHYDFEEGSDTAREASDSLGVFHEPDGQDVANASGKFGNAVTFAGSSTSYLFIPETGNFGNEFYALVFWVYPTSVGSAGQKQAIVSTNSANSRGETLYLENVSGNLQARWTVTLNDDTTATASSSTNLALSTWHMLVVWVYPDFVTSSSTDLIGISVNGAASTTLALDKPVKAGFSQIRLAGQPYTGQEQPFTGRIDHFTSYEGCLTPAEITLLYNSGSGRSFPFSTP